MSLTRSPCNRGNRNGWITRMSAWEPPTWLSWLNAGPVTARRTAEDYARQLPWWADVRDPTAQKSRLVQDNLNTQRLANLYLIFPPAEARRRSERFERHFTPTPGSWLDMAEIEIGLFERGCLGKRVASLDELKRRVAALEAERNATHATIDWRFTTTDARTKLARLYPKLEEVALPNPN